MTRNSHPHLPPQELGEVSSQILKYLTSLWGRVAILSLGKKIYKADMACAKAYYSLKQTELGKQFHTHYKQQNDYKHQEKKTLLKTTSCARNGGFVNFEEITVDIK